MIAATAVDGVHIVDKRLHRLMNTVDGAVDGVLQHTVDAFESVEGTADEIFNLGIVKRGIILAVEVFQHLDFLHKRRPHEGREIEVKRRNSLTAVHFVLSGLHRDAAKDARRLDALGRAALAVSCAKTVFQYLVERVLYACEALCGIVILVVDVDVALLDSLSHLRRE